VTRKDYERLARAFRRALIEAQPHDGYLDAWQNVLDAVADELTGDNPNFKRNRFYEAARS